MSEVPRRPGRIRGTTHVVGVIGWPVEGSLSPAIHNAAFSALDLDWVYVPLPVQPGHIAAAVAGLRDLGIVGANVTMPHKTDVAALVDVPSDDAKRLRAVNTIVVGTDGVQGHNTDAPGFDRFLREDAGFDPAGREALVFGAGGAARACALALARGGASRLVVAVRDPARASSVRLTLEGLDVDVEIRDMADVHDLDVPLVVNATPVGMRGETLPFPALHPGVLVVDLLYRPTETPLLELAKHAGATAFGGLGLLLRQAALSFELWTGQVPPLPVMSAAALSELAEPAGG